MKHLLTLLLFISTSVFSYEKVLRCELKNKWSGYWGFILDVNNDKGLMKIDGYDAEVYKCSVNEHTIVCAIEYSAVSWYEIEINRFTGEAIWSAISYPENDIRQPQRRDVDKGTCAVSKQKF